MPLDRLILILVCIAAVIGGTIWLVSLIWVSATLHPALALLPIGAAALVGYILVRVIGERVSNPDEDHYDGMKH